MTTETSVKQLPDGDAVFLSTETDTAWGHIGGMSILDPTGVPDFGYEKLVRAIESRLVHVPRFRWKLLEVPFGLDRPYWVECPDFDVRKHVHRIAVPAPGGMKELGELAGHLFARPLDRSRPLWEFWYIEGLADGKVAMFMKNHHCLMDGQAGVGLAEVLTDLSPDATAPPIVPDVMKEGTPVAPSKLEIAAHAARNALTRQAKRVEHIGRGLRAAASAWWPAKDEFAPPSWSDVPPLPFNKLVGMRRSFACASLDLDELKTIKKHFDVTLNDVVLEVIGGALRRWLRAKDELPERPIVAMCPVSLRAEGDQTLSNQITMMPVSLATDLGDPADRLRRIAKNSARSKETVKQGSFDVLAAVSESLAPGVVGLLMRAMAIAPDSVPLPGNLVVSNVRGVPIPLYTAGARMVSMYPMSVLQAGQGLNATVVSYMNKMEFGFTVDPDLVPDVDELCDQIHRSLEELSAAVEGVVHRAA
jgi:diacylglycerol O-acyltransferase / wax synthase